MASYNRSRRKQPKYFLSPVMPGGVVSPDFLPASLKSIIRPGITIITIPSLLPIPTDERTAKLNRAHEFGTLPSVKFGNDHPGRAAMVAGQRLAVQMSRNQDIIVQTRLKGNIRAIAIITSN